MMAVDAYLTNNTCYRPRSEHAQYLRNLQPVQWLDAACIKLSPVALRVITPTAPRLGRLTHTSSLSKHPLNANSMKQRLGAPCNSKLQPSSKTLPQKSIRKPPKTLRKRTNCHDGTKEEPHTTKFTTNRSATTLHRATIQLSMRDLLNRNTTIKGNSQTLT